ncbi:Protein of unknown function (modular protein) [Mycobacterium canettii CIPT 140070008]|nr:Protein of unknown function (modular protein) [Mycobacterium canettii CIPT 140070008]
MVAPSRSVTVAWRRRGAGSSRVMWAGRRMCGGIQPLARSVTSRVVWPLSRSPAAQDRAGSWRATVSRMRRRRCCSAARREVSPATAPVVAAAVALVMGGVGLLGWAWVVAGVVDLTTGDISEPPAAGEEGVTAAPEMGPVGVGGVAGGVVIGGRRSAP